MSERDQVTAPVGVVGCGKIGFEYLLWLRSTGRAVVGLDVDGRVRRRIADTFGAAAVAKDFGDLARCVSVHICVPTDPAPDGAADLSILMDVVEGLRSLDRPSSTLRFVSQRSTCPPGTGDEVAAHFEHLAYGVNPSFVRKASLQHDTAAPERVALGGPPEYLEYATGLYGALESPRFVSESRSAVELLKYAENAIDALMISFWNEMLLYGASVGVGAEDFVELLDAIGQRQKFASAARVPGRAFGMWCLPKDLAALRHAMDDAGTPTGTIAGACATNQAVLGIWGEGDEPGTALFETKDGRIVTTDLGAARVRAALDALPGGAALPTPGVRAAPAGPEH